MALLLSNKKPPQRNLLMRLKSQPLMAERLIFALPTLKILLSRTNKEGETKAVAAALNLNAEMITSSRHLSPQVLEI